MSVKQISVFVENKKGRLSQITDVLHNNNIDIRALSIADTADYGILRIIVSDTDKAYKALKEFGAVVSTTQVLAVLIPDVPGEFSKAVKALSDAGVTIEYSYAFITRKVGNACVIFRVENFDDAVKALVDAGFTVADGTEMFE